MTHPIRSVPSPSTGWKLFGELDLPPDPGADQILGTWLPETLNNLDLPASFASKILATAQQSVERARQVPAGTRSSSIRLLFFTPENSPPSGQTWGFFSMEKMATEPAGQSEQNSAIEFYLYPEG